MQNADNYSIVSELIYFTLLRLLPCKYLKFKNPAPQFYGKANELTSLYPKPYDEGSTH